MIFYETMRWLLVEILIFFLLLIFAFLISRDKVRENRMKRKHASNKNNKKET